MNESSIERETQGSLDKFVKKYLHNSDFYAGFVLCFIILTAPYLFISKIGVLRETIAVMLSVNLFISFEASRLFAVIALDNNAKLYVKHIVFLGIPVLLSFAQTAHFSKYVLHNSIIISCLYFALIIIFNDNRISTVICALLTGILAIVGQYLFLVKGNVLSFSDFYALKSALTVASGYGPRFDGFMYCVVIITIFAVILSFAYHFDKQDCVFDNIRFISNRRVMAVICAVMCLFFTVIDMTCSNYNRNFFAEYEDNYFGAVYNILTDFVNSRVKEPENYSSDNIPAILNRYDESNMNDKNMNIIVIMDESFADISAYIDIEMQEYAPFITSLTENTLKGQCIVPCYGGGTANTEFEFLTGLSMAFVPDGVYPYLQYIKTDIDTFVTGLDDRYDKIYAHPYSATNYDRNKIYKYLGFEEFDDDYYFVHGIDYGQRVAKNIENDIGSHYQRHNYKGDYGNIDTVRRFVSDKACVDNIISHYENKKAGEYLVEFVVTMQNHSPYDFIEDEDYYELICDSDENTNQYLYCLKQTDKAIESLITYFSNIDEDTVIVFFGDHQPYTGAFDTKLFADYNNIVNGDNNADKLKSAFVTPFFIWTNFNTQAETIDYVSVNYLSILMKIRAGLDLSPFESFLYDCYQKYPVITSNGVIDDKGQYFNIHDLSSDELINEYRQLQYYYLFDTMR